MTPPAFPMEMTLKMSHGSTQQQETVTHIAMPTDRLSEPPMVFADHATILHVSLMLDSTTGTGLQRDQRVDSGGTDN